MNKTIYYWSCDESESTGEGRLTIFFKKKLNRNFKFIKKININHTNRNTFLNHKYILPLIGIIICWIYFLKGKKVCYINYLPFWNFIIFLFLPPNTILGPITGGANFDEKKDYLRKYLFPILYKLSELIINIRNYKIIFATELLKKFLRKKTIKKSNFNFIIENFKKKSVIKKKTIDFFIYYRKHKNKEKFFPKNFIKKLILLKFNVYIVGDKLRINGVKNKGFLKNKEVIKFQKKSKYTIVSNENIYSLFTLESIQNNVIVILNKKDNCNLNFFKYNFYKVNFNKISEIAKLKNYDKNLLRYS